MIEFTELAAVLPVRDIAAAIEHYRKLGFDVRRYDGGAPYAFASRGPVQIHLSQVKDLDPATNTSAVYLYVADADGLDAEWKAGGAGGKCFDNEDTEYGLREGCHVDPDGNLIRYGSPLA